MTIVVGAASPDGLVLAGDRRATYFDGNHHRIASDYAQKVFALGDMGVATYGDAFIGDDTIAGLMDQFMARADDTELKQIDTFVESLGEFFDQRFGENLKEQSVEWDEAQHGFPLGFLIAGYDEQGIGHIRETLIPGPRPGVADATTGAGGVVWRGQTDVILRLVKGFDWQALERSNATRDGLPKVLRSVFGSFEYKLMPPITVQDAVDFTSFLVRTTIDMQRFSDGTIGNPGGLPGCGGSPLVLAIERSGPQWVSSPGLTRPSRSGWAEGADPAGR